LIINIRLFFFNYFTAVVVSTATAAESVVTAAESTATAVESFVASLEVELPHDITTNAKAKIAITFFILFFFCLFLIIKYIQLLFNSI
jgi:hypothetical protein